MSYLIDAACNNGYPYQETIPALSEAFVGSVPDSLFRCDGSAYPSLNLVLIDSLIEPLPASLCVQRRGEYPTLFPHEIVAIGTCLGCKNLRSVSIPESVRNIRDYAFFGTSIKMVRISKDCSYSEHSFPEGCVIETY